MAILPNLFNEPRHELPIARSQRKKHALFLRNIFLPFTKSGVFDFVNESLKPNALR